ncbi:hypothetical protein RGQ21_09720 [Kitasatospora aureofaciens]|nr:hypothetical protein RGQ21_09720 [Kitasatospora aureofaciens]
MSPVGDEKHRAVGVVQDPLTDGAQEHSAEAAVAPGAHDQTEGVLSGPAQFLDRASFLGREASRGRRAGRAGAVEDPKRQVADFRLTCRPYDCFETWRRTVRAHAYETAHHSSFRLAGSSPPEHLRRRVRGTPYDTALVQLAARPHWEPTSRHSCSHAARRRRLRTIRTP